MKERLLRDSDDPLCTNGGGDSINNIAHLGHGCRVAWGRKPC